MPASEDAPFLWPAVHAEAFAAGERRSLFLSRAWFESLIETVPELTTAPRIGAYHAGGSSALLPTSLSARGALAPRRLRAISNYYTTLFGIVGPSHSEGAAEGDFDWLRAAADALVAQLIEASPRPDSIWLSPLDPAAPDLAALESTLRARGWSTLSYFMYKNWYLECAGQDFKSYFAERPSKLRNTVNRKRKALFRDPAVRLEIYPDQGELDSAIGAFQQVYSRSWKQAEPYPEFIITMARRMAGQGWLRLGVVWLGDKPIAAQLWMVCHGVASIFKLAYDEAHQSLSAGSVLSAALMEYVLDVDQVHGVDYLTGDEPYKRDWMSHCGERRGLVATHPASPMGQIERLRHILAPQLKQRLRPT